MRQLDQGTGRGQGRTGPPSGPPVPAMPYYAAQPPHNFPPPALIPSSLTWERSRLTLTRLMTGPKEQSPGFLSESGGGTPRRLQRAREEVLSVSALARRRRLAAARHRGSANGSQQQASVSHLLMFHQVVPARALGPDLAGPPLYSALVPRPTSMSVYRVGPASALQARPCHQQAPPMSPRPRGSSQRARHLSPTATQPAAYLCRSRFPSVIHDMRGQCSAHMHGQACNRQLLVCRMQAGQGRRPILGTSKRALSASRPAGALQAGRLA